jgi:hypothetical protein
MKITKNNLPLYKDMFCCEKLWETYHPGFIVFNRKGCREGARKMRIKCFAAYFNRNSPTIIEEIFYCPFCGKKIVYANKSLKSK